MAVLSLTALAIVAVLLALAQFAGKIRSNGSKPNTNGKARKK